MLWIRGAIDISAIQFAGVLIYATEKFINVQHMNHVMEFFYYEEHNRSDAVLFGAHRAYG